MVVMKEEMQRRADEAKKAAEAAYKTAMEASDRATTWWAEEKKWRDEIEKTERAYDCAK